MNVYTVCFIPTSHLKKSERTKPLPAQLLRVDYSRNILTKNIQKKNKSIQLIFFFITQYKS